MEQVIEHGWIGTCDACYAADVEVRRVKIVGTMRGDNRGYVTGCFKCFSRRIFWVHPRTGKQMETPV